MNISVVALDYWRSKNVTVHPTAVLEGSIEIGEGTEIGPLCYLKGPLVIGKNNKIYPSCIIGTDAEHKGGTHNDPIFIGDDNVIRELTVIQRGSGEKPTKIGNKCFIMDHCHVAHDVVLHDEVTMSPNVVLGGHTIVMEGATIGIGAATHQFSVVGAYAMVGMNATVTKDIHPFSLVMGSPAKHARFNTHKFAKFGMTDQTFSRTFSKEIEELYANFDLLAKRK